jgi:hypothetical protein
MQNGFGIKVGFDEDIPHLFGDFGNYSIFRFGFDSDDFLQRNDQMFLEVMEQ